MLIKNGRIILKDTVFDGDLKIEDDKITELGVDLRSDSGEVIDAGGLYVCPGFVDIHTHGGYGFDFMESTEEAFSRGLAFHTDSGTTTVVPTSCTAPRTEIIAFLDYSREYISKNNLSLARVKGVHLEGPYLSEKNKGAQNPKFLAIPAIDDYSYMLAYKDVIKTVTISPEFFTVSRPFY